MEESPKREERDRLARDILMTLLNRQDTDVEMLLKVPDGIVDGVYRLAEEFVKRADG